MHVVNGVEKVYESSEVVAKSVDIVVGVDKTSRHIAHKRCKGICNSVDTVAVFSLERSQIGKTFFHHLVDFRQSFCGFLLTRSKHTLWHGARFFAVKNVVLKIVVHEHNRNIGYLFRQLVGLYDHFFLAVIRAEFALEFDGRIRQRVQKHVVERHVVVGAKPRKFRSRLAECLAKSAIKGLEHVEILDIHIKFIGDDVSEHFFASLPYYILYSLNDP